MARPGDSTCNQHCASVVEDDVGVRATVVDSLSRSFRTVVPEECVSDKHESPHYANLYDMALKYCDVIPVAEAIAHLKAMPANQG